VNFFKANATTLHYVYNIACEVSWGERNFFGAKAALNTAHDCLFQCVPNRHSGYLSEVRSFKGLFTSANLCT